MKIRIKGNFLRYRLTRSDVALFAKEGYIAERTEFGEQTLTYSLQRSSGGQISATFTNNQITFLMPATMVEEWTSTERVGFEGSYGHLHLLIEKDFKCLDDVAEDQSDNYPNPLAAGKD